MNDLHVAGLPDNAGESRADQVRLGAIANLNVVTRLGLSARAADRILTVARTIADLEGAPNIEPKHLSEAMQYRTFAAATGLN